MTGKEGSADESADALASPARTKPPYEDALLRAFDKLTSQIFLFLLAYLILLIGLLVLAPTLSIELRNLLYILPILGVAAYVLLQWRRIKKQARNHGVQVKSFWATRGAYIGGLRGRGASFDGNVNVRSTIARGAQVVGVDQGREGVEGEYLLRLYDQLEPTAQRKLVEEAVRLLEKRHRGEE
jgi:hypothetical protein